MVAGRAGCSGCIYGISKAVTQEDKAKCYAKLWQLERTPISKA